MTAAVGTCSPFAAHAEARRCSPILPAHLYGRSIRIISVLFTDKENQCRIVKHLFCVIQQVSGRVELNPEIVLVSLVCLIIVYFCGTFILFP